MSANSFERGQFMLQLLGRTSEALKPHKLQALGETVLDVGHIYFQWLENHKAPPGTVGRVNVLIDPKDNGSKVDVAFKWDDVERAVNQIMVLPGSNSTQRADLIDRVYASIVDKSRDHALSACGWRRWECRRCGGAAFGELCEVCIESEAAMKAADMKWDI